MPLGEEFSNTLLVKVDGAPLSEDATALLVNGYVDDSSGVPDLFVLRFNDERADLLGRARLTIGAVIELSVQSTAPGGPELLLEGEVTALEVEVTNAGIHTVVRGLDKSHRLFRGTRVEAFVQMTASEIASQVAQRAGLTSRVDATTTKLEHVTQDGVSDWDFLHRLAAENARVLSVERGRLLFLKRTSATTAPGGGESRTNELVLEHGVNLVSLRGTVTSNGQVPEVEVRGWDPKAKREVVAKLAAATGSAQLDTNVTPVILAKKFASPSYRWSRAGTTLASACTAAAEALSDHLAGGFAELEGTARGNPALRAGAAVRLIGVGTPFSGRYTLSSTRHDFSPELGYTTTFVVANTSERSLYGAATGGSRDGRARLGVVPAVVTNAKDPESLGRVKVKLPWLDDTYESGWARSVLPGAGAERGFVVLPEVGDEVLVAFAHDDLGHPYVLGGLFNGKDKPDKPWQQHLDDNSGAIKRRAWASRTGMLVEILESADDERLQISTNAGAQRVTLLQKEKGIEIVSEGQVSVTAKKEVTVVAQQAVSVDAKKDVTIKAVGNIDASTSGGNVTLKGANVTVEATANLDLKGTNVKVNANATAELAASATTTVRGALVRIN